MAFSQTAMTCPQGVRAAAFHHHPALYYGLHRQGVFYRHYGLLVQGTIATGWVAIQRNPVDAGRVRRLAWRNYSIFRNNFDKTGSAGTVSIT